MWFWISLVVVLFTLYSFYYFLHDHFRKEVNIGDNIIVLYAHPDDEVMMAGSIAKWREQGKKITAIYLTHGEDGPTSGICEQSELKEVRTKELQEVAQLLQYDKFLVYHYPDRNLSSITVQEICNQIKQDLELSFTTIFSFDDRIGLYGHQDHIHASRIATALANEMDCEYYQMTLSKGMKILANKVSSTFRKNNSKTLLPVSTHRVYMANFGVDKKKVIDAHRSQRKVMNDVQPLVFKIPASIYYSIFAYEYYTKVK